MAIITFPLPRPRLPQMPLSVVLVAILFVVIVVLAVLAPWIAPQEVSSSACPLESDSPRTAHITRTGQT